MALLENDENRQIDPNVQPIPEPVTQPNPYPENGARNSQLDRQQCEGEPAVEWWLL